MKRVSTHEAKTHLSRLITEACEGEDIIVCRGDLPMVRLVPVKGSTFMSRPKVGVITSEPVGYAEGAFEPLSEQELDEWGI